MHVPNPMGNFPMILRDSAIESTHTGELMLNYTTDDLYMISKINGTKKAIYTDIYQKMIETDLDNSVLVICKSDNANSPEPDIPEVDDRRMNRFYFNIQSRETPVTS